MKIAICTLAALVVSSAAFAQGTGAGTSGGAGTTGVVTGNMGAQTSTGIAPADGSTSMGTAGASGGMPGNGGMSAMPQSTVWGGTTVVAGSTSAVSGNTTTTTTRYWVNVPAGVERDADFMRWQRLR